jgi:KUP system potassium uptake protein
VRLNLWPKVKIDYPSEQKGQLYVPSVNRLLCVGCIGVVLLFRTSVAMTAAYGLSITIAMLMTTILVSNYLKKKKYPGYIVTLFLAVYLSIELSFLASNMFKFLHGGWFTVSISIILFSVMWTWFNSRSIRNRYIKFISVADYFDILKDLSADETVPKYASQLVYLTNSISDSQMESTIIYSILQMQPKRADIYWLLHVDVVDEPNKRDYEVSFLLPGKIIRIDFKLGFRVEQQLTLLFRTVVEELVKKGEVNITSKYPSLNKHKITGDFRFVVIEKVVLRSQHLSLYESVIMAYYGYLKKLSLSEEDGFGIDMSFVSVEKLPLILSAPEQVELYRVKKTAD